MRLLNMKRSSSLYLKGLITTGKQDQELGPWFNSKRSWRYSCSKQCLFHMENKNATKPNPKESDSGVI
jgi:hypothetical protein